MIIEKTINIALVNDVLSKKNNLSEALSTDSSFGILAEGVKVEEIISKIESSTIDVVIFQVDEPRYKEVEFLLSEFPNVKVIYISNSREKEKVLKIIKQGVHGYFYNENCGTKIKQRIKSIIKGKLYYEPEILQILLNDYIELTNEIGDSLKTIEYKLPLHLLTRRECEILQLLTDGKSNRGIAVELVISEKTVKNHVSNILQKLDVNDRTQAVVLGIRKGWVIF